MTRNWLSSTSWRWVLMAVIAGSPLIGSWDSVWGQVAEKQAKSKAKGVGDGKAKAKVQAKLQAKGKAALGAGADPAADQIIRAFRELNDAAFGPEEAANKGKVVMPSRPGRVVAPPTITPNEVDALVAKTIAEAKSPVARVTDDDEFIRRVYLDLTGKLPTPQQVVGFAKSNTPRKRTKLIEDLLASPDYGKHWARYWRDVISYRATNQNLRLIPYDDLEKWLTERFNANAPWDEIVTSLITAKGAPEENGAAVFLLAHADQRRIPAPELAGEISRIFLGVQIQCANCHNHPTDQWKREQFHEFAAFFSGTAAQRRSQTEPPTVVEDRRGARYTMTDLKDPSKEIPIAPRFFLASSSESVPSGLSVEQRRALGASYITGQDNPWFARAFVNRVWYVLLGEAFYNPVDDLGPERESQAQAAEVINVLAEQWQKGGYDVKWLIRTIMATKTYQREVRSTDKTTGKIPFAANCPSKLRPDQILDSLAHALGFPADGPPPGMGRGPGAAKGEALKKAIPAGLRGRFSLRGRFNQLFAADPSTPNDEIGTTIPQALFMMNNPLLQRFVRADGPSVLSEILRANPNNLQALNALYLRVLSREPTKEEVRVCGAYVDQVGNRKEAFEDILWSLINSTEFISRR